MRATTVATAGAAAALFYALPPRTIIMATGAEGGACYELGKRYRAELAARICILQFNTYCSTPRRS
jgi:hypothetical protein